VIASIQAGSSPDAIAFDPSNNFIYVANAGTNSVSVISGSNDATVATVQVGSSPMPSSSTRRTTRYTLPTRARTAFHHQRLE